jgi:hypothetical protein
MFLQIVVKQSRKNMKDYPEIIENEMKGKARISQNEIFE